LQPVAYPDSDRRMKNLLVKVLALLFSVGLAGAYVWHASKQRPEPVNVPAEDSDHQAEEGIVVSDEEVEFHRNLLMRSSKLGRVVDDEAVRKMLEERKREQKDKSEENAPPAFLYSTKNPAGMIDREQIENVIEKRLAPETPEKP